MEQSESIKLIKSYLTGLSSIINTVKNVHALYEPVNAFRFNLFNFWYPGENKISEILAFFLDPKQTHGQGDKFLKIFINKFEINEYISNTHNVSVKCEYAIAFQRRIDILITFYNDSYAIAIENKFGAGDQPNQIQDYSIYLKKTFKNHKLYYLTPTGINPSENSISKGDYASGLNGGTIQPISYTNNIIDLINQWSLVCMAERVRCFLNDLEQYFKQELLGETFMNENQFVADYALSTLDNLAAAFETYNAFGNIKDELGRRFTEKLTIKIKETFMGEDWQVLQMGNLNVSIANGNWRDNTRIGVLDFDSDRVHFSIKTNSANWENLYLKAKNEKGGAYNSNNWWLKLTPIYNKWDQKLEGLTAIYNLSEEAIIYIVDGLCQVANIVDMFFAKEDN